jgi:hypothetical protein
MQSGSRWAAAFVEKATTRANPQQIVLDAAGEAVVDA